ncbi:MAG TPA: hypothetical protein VNG71_11340 [Pyrinomonadaceae bacterium]|nr:hypothetical protein [Pyrinomonadaceae bacterium]
MKARFIHTLLLVTAIVSLTQSTFGQKLKFKTCNKPLPLQLRPFTNQPQRIDFLCGNTGCFKSAANDKQNAQKNNFCAPTDSVTPVTLATFGQLNDASNNEPSIPKGEPPESRAKLANIIKLGNGKRVGEGKTVSFVGYVLDARHSNVDKDNPLTAGNGESVQCNLLGCAYNDIHITLAEDPHESKLCNTIVGEIVPHYRPPAWDLFDSPDYVSFFKTHPVKIIGQLFFDGSHVPCIAEGKAGNNPARDNAKDFERLALWEIHPIYALDLCKFTDKTKCDPANHNAWLPFSELRTWLGLSSVRPTDKCQANTDDPNSKCPGFTLPPKPTTTRRRRR